MVEKWRTMEKRLTDIAELISLAEADKDTALAAEVQTEVEQASKQLEEMEFELAFSGQYDTRNAILSIHAGAGGTESQDWADMLAEDVFALGGEERLQSGNTGYFSREKKPASRAWWWISPEIMPTAI